MKAIPMNDVRRARILVIDDEENMRHMLSAILTRAGYDAEAAADGEQGLAMLQSDAFDCVLCDIRMPKMDGMTFLKAATAMDAGLTIIMMSAYGTIDRAIEAMKLGAVDFLEKPADMNQLTKKIKKAHAHKMMVVEKQIEEKMKKIMGLKGW